MNKVLVEDCIHKHEFTCFFSTSDIELADFPAKALLFGLTSTESYLDLTAQDLEYGFNETRRDRIFRTYVRNVYRFHLNEIFSTLKVITFRFKQNL